LNFSEKLGSFQDLYPIELGLWEIAIEPPLSAQLRPVLVEIWLILNRALSESCQDLDLEN